MNFNIDNYTIIELAEMFQLPNIYDKSIIEIKESQFKNNIINNKEINKETQIKTLDFIVKAKIKLIENKSNKSNNLNNLNNLNEIKDFFQSSFELKTTTLDESTDHMIQVVKEKPFLTTLPSEYFPGTINPLKRRTIKKNLNIDTRFRENYYNSFSTNFNITLPTNFNNVLTMQLSSIEIPTSFYSISKQLGNNFFTLIVNTETTIITIPDGNYTINGITPLINTLLLNLGAPFSNIVFIVNNTNNNGTGQMMVGLIPIQVVPIVTSFSLNFQADKIGNPDQNTPLPLKLGWMFGFRNGIYENNLNYVSEGIIDLSGLRYVYLVIDDYNNNVNNGFYSAFNSSLLNKNILARISLQADTFSILSENNLNLITIPREYFGPVNINNLTIQILDEYGRIINLNNMDYSFCLTLTTVYDLN